MSGAASQSSFLHRKVRDFLAPPAEYDWVLEAEWARIQQTPAKARRLLYGIAITILALVLWANFAIIDEVARGEGKVVPSQKLQVVQSYDGGIVQDILIREGQQVAAGQVLVRVDPTRFVSSLQENASQQEGLQAKADRLRALIDNRPLEFSVSLGENAAIKSGEQALYRSNLQELEQLMGGYHSRISQKQQDLASYKAEYGQYKRSKELIDQELAVTRPLLASGAVSQMDILRLERQQVELDGSIQRASAAIQRSESTITEERNAQQEARLRMINQWRRELAEATSKLGVLKQSKTGLEDVVAQSELRSPIKGTVQRLLFNTVGGVISPGSQVVEIVPLDDQLIVEAKISPKDIAFIQLGQPAILKFSAYDFAIYGGMEAEVEHISADTITDDKDNTFYVVRLRTVTPVGDEPLEILPGMTAQVDIVTGERSVMNFILKPILNAASSALKER
ncbi:HlyD family type I secretion periplasmic adaptor subunit [Alteromonas lipotrueiana]|uniref:HlyD family type I secretion periplasmic adaptor subunit n=1 Tax=Alteromonas lipotrueiana TaxID=2803815 RepID=UPI001C46C67D|nr:HlyD family type I secretion periplasmic adaptor subunit [Alteromonas lipotrueiana]